MACATVVRLDARSITARPPPSEGDLGSALFGPKKPESAYNFLVARWPGAGKYQENSMTTNEAYADAHGATQLNVGFVALTAAIGGLCWDSMRR